MVAGVELTYDTSASALLMAQTIFGDNVTVTGATYTGDNTQQRAQRRSPDQARPSLDTMPGMAPGSSANAAAPSHSSTMP